MLPQRALTIFRLGFLENLYDWEGRRGGKCPYSLFAYISRYYISAKSVIQGCIEKEFPNLLIEILKCCNKILFRMENVSFRKVVNFRKLAEKQRLVSES